LQQLDEGQWRPGLAVFIAGEGIDPSAEDLRGLALVEIYEVR